MVRLITHNMLACHVRKYPWVLHETQCSQIGNCNKDNFPLVFSDVELVIRPAPENYDFLRRFLPKLEWNALVDTARSVCLLLSSSDSRV
jgi:multifunctional methyltransferase subunit TRM112